MQRYIIFSKIKSKFRTLSYERKSKQKIGKTDLSCPEIALQNSNTQKL
jgi:hypothetical protein